MNMTGISLRGCFVVAVGCLFCLYQFAMQAAPGFIVHPLMEDLALNRTETGILGSSILYTYVLLQMPAGWLIDRYGVKAMFLSCLACMVAGILLFSQACSLEMAVLGRMLEGAGSASAIVGTLCLAAVWFPPPLFPIFVGLIEMSAMLGGAVCGTAIPELSHIFDWRIAMVASAVFGAVLWVLMLFISNHPEGAAESATASKSEKETGGALKQVFGSRQVWLSSAYGFGLFGLVSVFGMMWGVSFLENLYPESSTFAAHAMSMLFVGLSAGTVLCGLIVAKGGNCRSWMIYGAGFTLFLLVVIIFVQVPPLVMTGLLFLLGLAMGSYGLSFVAPEGALPKSGLGLAMAFINASLLVSGQVLQPVLGRMLDLRAATNALSIADYQMAFIPLLVLAVMSLLASLFLREVKGHA